MSETPAINLYLAERYNVGELAPSIGEAERGPFLSRLFFLSGDLEPILKRMFYPERFVLRPGDEAEMSEKSLREALQRMQLIERDLEHRGPYQLGPRFSLLDIILSFWVEYVNVDGALETCPALLRCYQLVRERPRIRPCFEQMIEQRAEYARLRQTSAGAD